MANGSSETEILALVAFRHAFRQTTPAVALNHPPATASACSIETTARHPASRSLAEKLRSGISFVAPPPLSAVLSPSGVNASLVRCRY